MTLDEFSHRISQLGDNVVRNANDIKKEATRTLVRELTTHTPADVGTAISNWQVSKGGPAVGTIAAYAPGKYGSTATQNAVAAQNEADAIIEGTLPGQDLHTTNNLRYIDILNSGYSRQAPAGFVEAGINVAINEIQTISVLKD
jgi:hypothetical protein